MNIKGDFMKIVVGAFYENFNSVCQVTELLPGTVLFNIYNKKGEFVGKSNLKSWAFDTSKRVVPKTPIKNIDEYARQRSRSKSR